MTRRASCNLTCAFLDELKIETIIGIWEWERRIRQTVVIDLEMSADIAKAAATDDVADTLNYKLVAKRIQQFVGESSFQLVETLAVRIDMADATAKV